MQLPEFIKSRLRETTCYGCAHQFRPDEQTVLEIRMHEQRGHIAFALISACPACGKPVRLSVWAPKRWHEPLRLWKQLTVESLKKATAVGLHDPVPIETWALSVHLDPKDQRPIWGRKATLLLIEPGRTGYPAQPAMQMTIATSEGDVEAPMVFDFIDARQIAVGILKALHYHGDAAAGKAKDILTGKTPIEPDDQWPVM
jgi:hypothetical protein